MGLVWSLFVLGVSFANKFKSGIIQQTLMELLGYASSVDHELIKVEDLGMGTTAIATKNTWICEYKI
jgi:hypothetical protein